MPKVATSNTSFNISIYLYMIFDITIYYIIILLLDISFSDTISETSYLPWVEVVIKDPTRPIPVVPVIVDVPFVDERWEVRLRCHGR